MARRSVTIVASDGKSEEISWYDGATEASVIRCALLALGLPAGDGGTGSAATHLLWPSGDTVDFGKPITEGVTLHLDTTALSPPQNDDDDDDDENDDDDDDGGYSVVPYEYNVDGGGFSDGGGGGGGNSTVAQRRVSSAGANTAEAGGGGRGRDGSGGVTAPQRGGSITAPVTGSHNNRRRQPQPQPQQRLRRPSESSLARRRALLTIRRFFGVQSGGVGDGRNGGMLSRFIDRVTSGAADSDEELERRPLLGIGRVSSSTSLLSRSSSSGGGGGGGGRVDGGAGAEDEVDGDGNNPDHQRTAILKLKRINAHLANERTLLAWVRCVGKMFSAGVLCLTLASESGGGSSLGFLGMGAVYLSMGPYVVYVGSIRYYQAEEVMQGSPYEAYEYFSGSHLRSLTFLNLILAALTVALMVNQLFISL